MLRGGERQYLEEVVEIKLGQEALLVQIKYFEEISQALRC